MTSRVQVHQTASRWRELFQRCMCVAWRNETSWLTCRAIARTAGLERGITGMSPRRCLTPRAPIGVVWRPVLPPIPAALGWGRRLWLRGPKGGEELDVARTTDESPRLTRRRGEDCVQLSLQPCARIDSSHWFLRINSRWRSVIEGTLTKTNIAPSLWVRLWLLQKNKIK